MKILITGSNGFIGSRLAEHLQRNEREVVGVGRQPISSENAIGEYRIGNLANADDCDRVSKGIEAVVHCAGKAGAWGDFKSYELANVQATQNLIDACKRNGIRRFINVSSPSIYFDYKHQFNLTESQRPQRFSNAYAATKFAAEQIVTKAHCDSLWTLSFRPRGVIGAGDRNWLPRIIEMRQSGSLFQPGNGSNLADFTSVTNLIHAVDLALQGEFAGFGRVYNITDGKPQKLWDVIDKALQAVDLDGERKRVPRAVAMGAAWTSWAFHTLRRSETEPSLLPIKVGVASYSMTLDISAARRHLGYSPISTTDEAIADFARWWSKLNSKT